MSLIDSNKVEYEKIIKWAETYSCRENLFADELKVEDSSYLRPFDNVDNVVEYDFDTIITLRKDLGEMWNKHGFMEEIIIPCAVSVFKSKPTNHSSYADIKLKNFPSKDVEIKDFIYMF